MFETLIREGLDAERAAELNELLDEASFDENAHALTPEDMRDLALSWGGEVSA